MHIAHWFRGLRAKLLILAAIPMIAVLIVAYQGYSGAHVLGNDLEKAVKDDLPTAMHRGDMDAAVHTMTLWLLNTYSIPTNTEARNKAIEHAEKEMHRFVEAEKAYEKLDLSPEEMKIYAPIKEEWPKLEKAVEHTLALLKTHVPADNEKANAVIHAELMPVLHVMDEAFEKLDKFQVEKMAEEIKHSEHDEKHVYRMIILFSLIGSALALVFAITLATRLSTMLGHLSDNLSEGAKQVASASTQVASASQELSQANVEQAASLEETASSLEEITAMISKATENATNTADNSSQSQQKAEEGRLAMEKMMRSMNEIRQGNEAIVAQVTESNVQMTEIVRVIQEIGNKTKVINEIVFQTKLLSFNASVEAARAGEQGKGFAVVAEEVGSLARMSGSAAKEITDMLDSSIAKVERIVAESKTKVESLVGQGQVRIDAGVDVARKCSDLLNEIVINVAKVSNLSQEISKASQEQSVGVGEINKALSQLDSVTQQNAGVSEEAASAAEELSAQAESLKSAAHELQLAIHGDATPVPVTSALKPDKKIVVLRPPKKDSVTVARTGTDGPVPDRTDDGFSDI